MINVCQNCGKEIEADSLFCTYCGVRKGSQAAAVLSASSSPQRKNKKFLKLLCALGIIGLLVVLTVVLNANMLLPWQWGARLNKRAIFNYAAEHYPEAIVLDQHYNSLNFNLLKSSSDDYITFKQDLLEFSIFARDGKITIDDYPKIRAIAQFDKIIQDGFLKPRGIAAQTYYGFSDDYYKIYPYTGGLRVTLMIHDQNVVPQEIGWLYEFYKYWKEKAVFLKSYSVFIDVEVGDVDYEIMYNKSDIFLSKNEFYALFK